MQKQIALELKTKTTSRKFYGKWLYKASFRLEGCALFRSKTIEELEKFLEGAEPTGFPFSTHKKAWHNADLMLGFCRAFKTQSKDQYSLRIESGWMDVYTNDEEFYKSISTEFQDILRHRFEPSQANLELIADNRNIIAVDKLPKGRFRYRVYLLPHKMNGDRENKRRFLDWLKSQSPRTTCTPAVEKWFMETNWNWDRRYILVEDEATLLMMKLKNSEVVGRVYNFVISDK